MIVDIWLGAIALLWGRWMGDRSLLIFG